MRLITTVCCAALCLIATAAQAKVTIVSRPAEGASLRITAFPQTLSTDKVPGGDD